MAKFKIGNTVEAIDDAIKGEVTKVVGNTITIKDEFGFDFQFEANALILSPNTSKLKNAIYNSDIDKAKQEKQTTKPKAVTKAKAKKDNTLMFEVDLHIHQLTDSTKGLTPFDMLNLQLATAQRQLEFAIKKRIPKLVFIHGVGEGVLRQELATLLRRYNNVTFYDANFKTYGFGATEVKIFQSLTP